MANSILTEYLRGSHSPGDLVKTVRSAAQETVLRRLVDAQARQDAQVLIDEINAKLPALTDRVAYLDELIAQGDDAVKAKRLEKVPHLTAREEGNIRAERLVVARAEEAILRIEREAADLAANLTTERNRRNMATQQMERMTNALAELQPLVESSGASAKA